MLKKYDYRVFFGYFSKIILPEMSQLDCFFHDISVFLDIRPLNFPKQENVEVLWSEYNVNSS